MNMPKKYTDMYCVIQSVQMMTKKASGGITIMSPETKEINIELLAHRVDELWESRKIDMESHRKIFTRLEEIEKSSTKQYSEVNTGLLLGDARFNSITAMLEELKADMAELKAKPKHRYDLIVTSLISSVVAGGAAFIIASIIGHHYYYL